MKIDFYFYLAVSNPGLEVPQKHVLRLNVGQVELERGHSDAVVSVELGVALVNRYLQESRVHFGQVQVVEVELLLEDRIRRSLHHFRLKREFVGQ